MQQKVSDNQAPTEHPRDVEGRSRRLVPALTVVCHPNPERIGERLLLEALAISGRPAALSRNAPELCRPGGEVTQPLADPFLSRTPVQLELGSRDGLRLVVPEHGTRVQVGDEPVPGLRELPPEAVAAGVPLVLAGRVVLLLHLARAPEPPAQEAMDMVGASERLLQVREDIHRVADLDVPVLVRGETGTGKELVARAIHDHGPRRAGPFVSVNLGALSRELVAAELFGTQRGAYTGAHRDREGFFRAAHGGTLFLDEVGEAPLEVQNALLRVLETGEVYPVGSHSPVRVDVRLVAATDASLEERVEERLFKAPLLHRLAGFEILVPPLRERREDIGPLFLHFARRELEAMGDSARLTVSDPRAEPWLPAPLAVRLVSHAWPGNVRQLRNVARQLVIGSRGLPSLQASARLEQELGAGAMARPRAVPWDLRGQLAPAASRRKPSTVSEEELLEALRASGWDLQATADRLGISRPSVYLLIDKSTRLRAAGDLSPEEITRCHHDCDGDLDRMVQQLQVSRRALQRRVRELGLEG